MNTEQIAKFIITKPYLIQIAKDDIWEKTWNIDLLLTIPSRTEITKYLNETPYKSIAVEALFKGEDGVFILGLIFNNNLLISNAEDFLDLFIKETYKYRSFVDFINRLESAYIGSKYFFIDDPDLIRIGVVNHWFSVGPCLIWQNGWIKNISNEILEQLVQKKPEVIETKLNYQCMSFVFNLDELAPGLCYWIKSPCSKNINGIWTLDREMILKYLKEWMGFKLSK